MNVVKPFDYYKNGLSWSEEFQEKTDSPKMFNARFRKDVVKV